MPNEYGSENNNNDDNDNDDANANKHVTGLKWDVDGGTVTMLLAR